MADASQQDADAPVAPSAGGARTLERSAEGATNAEVDRTVSCRAYFVGERIDTRYIERSQVLAALPLTFRAGASGYAVLFRFGVMVLFDVTPIEEADLRSSLEQFIDKPETGGTPEQIEVRIDPANADTVDSDGIVRLRTVTPDRLQVIAGVLAKSLILEHYESRLSGLFDRMEPVAETLRRGGRGGGDAKALLQQIGNVLSMQHRMVGRVEVVEKPDVLWDHPELERLHARLVGEFELDERGRALDRKLQLISDTAEALLDLVHTKSSLRVEWYIVILILVEIVLSLYDLFFKT
jgi:uncharacterized Rmd1/YagE family protein